MPTYEYACRSCDEHHDVVQKFGDDPLTTCPSCGGPLRKVFGAVGVVFKGSGFYKTDSRAATKNGGKADKADKSEKSDKTEKADKSEKSDKAAASADSGGSASSSPSGSKSSDSAGSGSGSSPKPGEKTAAGKAAAAS
jgi:putative FmdB family regulatory protein